MTIVSLRETERSSGAGEPVTCSVCHRTQPPPNSLDRVEVLSSFDVEAVRRLLSEDASRERCDTCGATMPGRRSVLLKCAADIGFLVPGADVEEDAFAKAAFDRHGVSPEERTVFDSTEELVEDVRVRTLLFIGHVIALDQMSGETEEWIEENWAMVGGEAFVGMQLLAEGDFLHYPAWSPEGSGEDSTERAFERLSQLQLRILCTTLVMVKERRLPFGPMIDFQFAPGPILERTLAALAERYEETEDRHLRALYNIAYSLGRRRLGLPDDRAYDFTRSWLVLEMHAPPPEERQMWHVDPEIVPEMLSYRGLVDGAAELVQIDGERVAAILDSVGQREVLRKAVLLPPDPGELEPERLCPILDEALAEAGPEMVAALHETISAWLVENGRREALLAFCNHAADLVEDEPQSFFKVIAVGTQALIDIPDVKGAAALLERLEKRGGAATKSRTFAIAKANVLRSLGRHEEALEALATPPEEETPMERLALNQAVLLCDAGRYPEAIAELRGALRSAVGETRFHILDLLGTCLGQTGQIDEAIAVLEEALSHGGGDGNWIEHRIRAELAMMQAAHGRERAALENLEAIEVHGRQPRTLALAAAALAHLRSSAPDLIPASLLERYRNALVEQLRPTLRSESWEISLNLLGGVIELAGPGEGMQRIIALEAAVNIGTKAKRPDAHHMLELARLRLKQNPARATQLVRELPLALAERFGGSRDVSPPALTMPGLRRRVMELADRAYGAGLPADSELTILLAELQREPVAQARRIRSGVQSAEQVKAGLAPERLERLAPARGSLHVFDSLQTEGEAMRLRLTRIGADGAFEARWLVAPTRPTISTEELRARCNAWRANRAGSPLDHPGWRTLAEWFEHQLEPASPADRIVVFEQAGIAFPWHATDLPCPLSYATGWNDLLQLQSAPADPRRPSRLGVFCAPVADEGETVLSAFAESIERTRQLANRLDCEVLVAAGIDADAGALRELFSSCDVLKLLCHGFRSAQGGEVGMLVAADGALPSSHPIAAGHASARAHRASWRDLHGFDAAPSLVLSAACSTGAPWYADGGDRIGVYGALRFLGGRSLVAPAWDGKAIDVIGAIDRTCEGLLVHGKPLGRALWRTRWDEDQSPPWRRRALTLTGDWR